jgi:ribose 5-phosphate isomerase A
MTIVERALELIQDGVGEDGAAIGLGSGRAAQAFVRALGERVRGGAMRIRGVATSEETAALARQVGIPLVTLQDAGELAVTIDGADEVDPNLNLIKGYGRALVREKIVAASSQRLIILVGEEKLVPQLGSRGKLPVEVVPFGLPLCEHRLRELGCKPVPFRKNGQLFVSDNGNHIIDCEIAPITAPSELEQKILDIPGVLDTGLFLGMADVVLVGDSTTFRLIDERRRPNRS